MGLAMEARVALKEWSVVVEAVRQGVQLLLVRKGGIRDPKGAFVLEHREFLLYPTWEHQRPQCIRPEFRERFQQLFQAPPTPDRIRFEVYAGVALCQEVQDPAVFDRLQRYHIWTPDFFARRLEYRPGSAAQLLVIRAYRFPRPLEHPVRPGEAGCKSWVTLEEPVSLTGAEPVMDDRRFRAALEEIHSRIQDVSRYNS
jgi:hypothetical protein